NGSLGFNYETGPPNKTSAPFGGAGLSPSGPVITVEGIAAEVALSLIGANGHATVNVGNDSSSLDDLHGPLTITGAHSSVALNVHDQGAAAAQVYTLDRGTLTRSGAAPITADVRVNLTLDGGRGGNRFDVESLASGVATTVNAGAGGDLVRMRGGPVLGA